MTQFYVMEMLRISPVKIIVRLEKGGARSDDPDRYKWLAAVDAEGAIELIPIDETGDLCNSDVLEEVRSEVEDFIATEDETLDDFASYTRETVIKQFEADQARRINLLKRAERRVIYQGSETLRIEKMASDLGCTVALAQHIDGLERRLRAVDAALA
jgi:hypothetical protein